MYNYSNIEFKKVISFNKNNRLPVWSSAVNLHSANNIFLKGKITYKKTPEYTNAFYSVICKHQTKHNPDSYFSLYVIKSKYFVAYLEHGYKDAPEVMLEFNFVE